VTPLFDFPPLDRSRLAQSVCIDRQKYFLSVLTGATDFIFAYMIFLLRRPFNGYRGALMPRDFCKLKNHRVL